MVPWQVLPWTFLLFGGYLRLVYQWGKVKATQAALYSSDPESLDYDYRKGHQRQVSSYDAAALYYGSGMAFLAIVAPLLAYLLGITALFVRNFKHAWFHYVDLIQLLNAVNFDRIIRNRDGSSRQLLFRRSFHSVYLLNCINTNIKHFIIFSVSCL
ncbi:inositol phosphorylceramide glucuronosyltransferase 1-like [Amaranthus tricolor]|uniref:inositol phosphorylceramide glucuronosyltransferase 1-like n=1 Tax=Amaranthus tricolor TaxID=29722 RepID=UPI00258AA061|nr:inositol phosphorylceramide glucuronosyltransferase 1-like [Amaranthus tricolor]